MAFDSPKSAGLALAGSLVLLSCFSCDRKGDMKRDVLSDLAAVESPEQLQVWAERSGEVADIYTQLVAAMAKPSQNFDLELKFRVKCLSALHVLGKTSRRSLSLATLNGGLSRAKTAEERAILQWALLNVTGDLRYLDRYLDEAPELSDHFLSSTIGGPLLWRSMIGSERAKGSDSFKELVRESYKALKHNRETWTWEH